MGIEAENLSVARGGLPVLEGVTFTLAPGAALTLTGPNGSGKTTLLRTVAGLQPALAGRLGRGRGHGARLPLSARAVDQSLNLDRSIDRSKAYVNLWYSGPLMIRSIAENCTARSNFDYGIHFRSTVM